MLESFNTKDCDSICLDAIFAVLDLGVCGFDLECVVDMIQWSIFFCIECIRHEQLASLQENNINFPKFGVYLFFYYCNIPCCWVPFMYIL